MRNHGAGGAGGAGGLGGTFGMIGSPPRLGVTVFQGPQTPEIPMCGIPAHGEPGRPVYRYQRGNACQPRDQPRCMSKG